jgi:hypothetical protein
MYQAPLPEDCAILKSNSRKEVIMDVASVGLEEGDVGTTATVDLLDIGMTMIILCGKETVGV